ncbi:MAG: beta strand repeat-containing protein, partial [Hominilimicola sp.]
MKKRLLSLFVVFSMLASVLVIPSTALAVAPTEDGGSINVFQNINITHKGGGQYDVTFDVEDGTAERAWFMVVTENFASEELGSMADMDGWEQSSFISDCGYTSEVGNTISSLINNITVNKTDNGTYSLNKFSFSLNPSVYQDSGTTYYLLMKANTASGAYILFDVDQSGAATQQLPQTPVTLELNGGTLANAPTSINSGTYSAENLASALGTPTKTGYSFGGWSETNGGTAISGDITLVKDTAKTFYALWSEKTAFPTDKISISPTSVNYNGTAQKPTLVIDSSLTGVTASDITLKYDGTANASGQTNAKTYAITASVAETANYKATATDLDLGTWTINKVDYTPGTVASTIPIGTAIENYEFDGTVKGVNNSTVAGTFKITTAGKGNAVAGQTYDNLSWTFTPTTANENYNTLTGTNATLTGASKTDKAVTLTIPQNVIYDGNSHAATATVGDLASTAYNIEYKKTTEGDSSYTTTAPINAGTYDVRVVFTGNNGDLYNMTGTTTGTLAINKKTVKINAINGLTKVYDGGETAKKADKSDLAITDLTLDTTDVNLVVDGTFKAEYNSANVKDATKITISGVTLSDTDNYTLDASSLEMSAEIKPLEVTATLKASVNKSTKVYSKEISLGFGDFDFDLTAVDLETVLAGIAFDSDAIAATADVDTYDIDITQPSSGNYDVTTDSQIEVTACPTLIVVTPNTGLKYKDADYTDAQLFTATVYANPDNATDATGLTALAAADVIKITATYTKNSAAVTAVKDAGDYTASVDATVSSNYSAPTAAEKTISIAKADISSITVTTDPTKMRGYLPREAFDASGAKVTATYNAGTDYEYTADVTATVTEPANAVAGQTLALSDSGSAITFSYTEAGNDNINAAAEAKTAQTTDTITVAKSDNEQKPAVTAVNASTAGGNGKLVISKADGDTVTSDTAEVEYKLSTADTWTTATFTDGTVTVAVPAGTYYVRYKETDTTNAGNYVQAEVSDAAANTNTPDVKVTAPTTVDGKGTITISKKADDEVTSDTAPVQYRLKGTEDWTDAVFADGTVTVTVPVGTYEVRYAATEGFAPGTVVGAVVPQAVTYKITVVTPAEDAHGTFTYTVGDGAPTSTDTAKVLPGTTVKITATPESTSYKVSKITLTAPDGKTTSVSTTKSEFTMPENDVTIDVTFAKKSTSSGGGSSVVSYKVTYDAGEHGKITSGSASETVTSSAKPKAVPTVTANEGYKFVGWTQDG